MATTSESDLYPPVKAFLTAQGYDVKGEVGACDVVAVRGAEDPVIVELKRGFTLALVHQGIARQAVTDAVYLAVPRWRGGGRAAGARAALALCRRLGLGLLAVRPEDGTVEPLCDPAPYAPRRMTRRRTRLLREFARMTGDPNRGGMGRRGIVTAYRQDALRCAAFLTGGPAKGAVVARATGVVRATRLMADNHHGWFARVTPGIYRLTAAGAAAVAAGDVPPPRAAVRDGPQVPG